MFTFLVVLLVSKIYKHTHIHGRTRQSEDAADDDGDDDSS